MHARDRDDNSDSELEHRVDSDSEVLSGIWLSAFLQVLKHEEPARLVHDRIREAWPLLEHRDSFDDCAAICEALVEVSNDVDLPALRRDALKHSAGGLPELAANEWMLAATKSGQRSKRGVFTTPDALADFLVEEADRRLREEFGLPDGLADDSSWGAVAERLGFSVPSGVSAKARFVRILDPATGSGVFPLAIARRARKTLFAKWEREGVTEAKALERWSSSAGPDLARALVLYELMPVPRALARWHLSHEFGGASPEVRAENPLAIHDELPFPITVTLGNPPYSVRAGSLDAQSRALIEPYRFESGEKLVEKGALRLEMHLQDDYVKFIRLAELQVERAGLGVVALVTNSSYLDSPSLRGLRASLANTFDRLGVVNLHGARTRVTSELREAGDQNVFGIGQGVATLVGSRCRQERESLCATHGELVGSRDSKLLALAGGCAHSVSKTALEPQSPGWYFVPRDTRHSASYDSWIGLKQLFQSSVSGIVTAHDRLVVAFEDSVLREKARLICDERLSVEELRAELGVRDNAGWKLERARARFLKDPHREDCIRDYSYRPFDTRRILYHPSLVWCDRRRVMSSLGEPSNMALAVCRQLAAPPWQHVFATRELMDDNYVSNRSRERTHLFPLYRRMDPLDSLSPLVSNLNDEAVQKLLPNHRGVPPEDVFHYVYAILHSDDYRERHRDSLAVDFPRIPQATSEELFERLVRAGRLLLDAHLLPGSRDEKSASSALHIRGSGEPIVARGFPKFADERVLLSEDFALEPISRAAWNFTVGSYFPCRKWLKDRVGIRLSPEDLAAYARVVGGVLASLRALEELPKLAAPVAVGANSSS